MFWVLQSGFFDAGAFTQLRACLAAQDVAHMVVDVNARTLALSPEVSPRGPVFVCGSSTLGRVARARGWRPGYFDENLDYRLLARHYGEHLLNADADCVSLRDASPRGAQVFVRPVNDLKGFAGSAMSR